MRPVPQLEIPPSDDENEPQQLKSPIMENQKSVSLGRNDTGPEVGNDGEESEPFQDSEEPSDLEEARLEAKNTTLIRSKAENNLQKKGQPKKKKPKSSIGKQVSNNFVSYKIRSKGRHGRGRFRRR